MSPFNCREVSTRIAMGELETAVGWQRFKIKFHLAYCWFCRKYERQLRMLALAYRAVSEQKIVAADSAALKKKIIQQHHA